MRTSSSKRELRNSLKLGLTGFTLVEVMVAVSLLSLGTVMIYQSNLMSLNVFSRHLHRLSLQNWAEEQIWKAKEEILGSDTPSPGSTSGVYSTEDRDYEWQLHTAATGTSKDGKVSLYQIFLTVSWQEGGGKTNLWRVAHVQKTKQEP